MLISKSSGMTVVNESNLNDIQPVGNSIESDDSAFDRISADITSPQQLNELKILISHLRNRNYDFVRQIGKGATANVYLFYSRRYFEYFVVKCFSGKISDNLFCHRCELDALINLNSPNVVRVYDYVISENVLYFILEYCELGSMKDFIDHRGVLTGDTLLYVCFELLKGLQFIHVRNIAHLDIKPDNILIDKYGRVKYCDFGYSKVFQFNDVKFGQKAGTPNYMAPEVLYNKAYDPFKVDIYALGVTFSYLATGKNPWIIQTLKNLKPQEYGRLNTELFDNIMMMVDPDPTKRPSCQDLLNMPIFANFDRNTNPINTGQSKTMKKVKKIQCSMSANSRQLRLSPGNDIPVVNSNSTGIQLHVHNQPFTKPIRSSTSIYKGKPKSASRPTLGLNPTFQVEDSALFPRS